MKRKQDASIKKTDEGAKAPKPERIVSDSNYNDRSICGLIMINLDAVDYIILNYRSLLEIKGDKLVNAENYNEKRMLRESREDFPAAKMVAFYSRGNWHLQIRDLIREVLSSPRIKIKGSTGKNKWVYRLPSGMTKEDALMALNKAIRTGRCKDYLRLKEIDLESMDVINDELDDINSDKEQEDINGNKELDNINRNKKQDNMEESKLKLPVRTRRRTKAQIMMDKAAADTKQRRIKEFLVNSTSRL